jgi:hypothetical protein
MNTIDLENNENTLSNWINPFKFDELLHELEYENEIKFLNRTIGLKVKNIMTKKSTRIAKETIIKTRELAGRIRFEELV